MAGSGRVCLSGSRSNSRIPDADQFRHGVAEFLESRKFHKFGKSRHCCGLTCWTAQSFPSRNTHSPFVLSVRPGPACHPRAGEPLDKVKLGDAFELGEPRDLSSGSAARFPAKGSRQRKRLAFEKNRQLLEARRINGVQAILMFWLAWAF